MFLLPISWSFVIFSPCAALCCPISSVSHFSWSQFVRQPPIMKQCHITGWGLKGGRWVCLNVCSSCKCETPEICTSNPPHASQHILGATLEPCLSSWWKARCVCVLSSNAAAQYRLLVADGAVAGALQRLSSLSAASALLSLSSHRLCERTVKSTADLGQISSSEVEFKACRFDLESRWPQI